MLSNTITITYSQSPTHLPGKMTPVQKYHLAKAVMLATSSPHSCVLIQSSQSITEAIKRFPKLSPRTQNSHWHLIIFLFGFNHFNPMGFPGGSDGKESAEDPGLIPGSGRSPGEGNGNPLQYFCLENPVDRRSYQPTFHGVTNLVPS